MRLRVIMVPYVLRNELVFLQDSAPRFKATACTEYLQLGELLPAIANIAEVFCHY